MLTRISELLAINPDELRQSFFIHDKGAHAMTPVENWQ
jgi:hypothetical protein